MNLKEIQPGFWVSDTGMVFKEVPQNFRGPKTHRYPYVAIKGVKTDVHRLVAKAFIPNPDNKPCVLHADDDPQNPDVSNLRWGTHLENSQDMVDKGRARFFSKMPAKLAVILDGIEQGLSLRDLADLLNITEGRVSQIVADYHKRVEKREKFLSSQANS